MKVIEDKIYLEIAELEGYGIPKKTIYNGLALNKAGKTTNWRHDKPANSNTTLIDVDSIATTSLKKLPAKTKLLEEYLEKKNKETQLLQAVKTIQHA